MIINRAIAIAIATAAAAAMTMAMAMTLVIFITVKLASVCGPIWTSCPFWSFWPLQHPWHLLLKSMVKIWLMTKLIRNSFGRKRMAYIIMEQGKTAWVTMFLRQQRNEQNKIFRFVLSISSLQIFCFVHSFVHFIKYFVLFVSFVHYKLFLLCSFHSLISPNKIFCFVRFIRSFHKISCFVRFIRSIQNVLFGSFHLFISFVALRAW